ncbi:acyl-CoA transferase/carnitine dehydratase [Novosphingobium pentaromativorans US6-1]|uniref:Acyl-CoA transferase/carnitine dehydratase n=1 Tax=Novosphingobium pentaromativorans US6-1 TaxID=1088721 RepID=G6ED98_9SPHN|nr:acyl-CoA transferase/carnitine dehydratase [Novosphingobium pentaromativorans US6-1]
MEGLRVLDLGRYLAAPWCTQLLGDLGAEVIKVERPGKGDDMRSYGPPFLKNREGEDDDSPYYISSNRNKKSVTVNIANPDGAQLIRDLARECDILVENYKVGDLKRFGLDYNTLKDVNPHLIYCSVTGFGQSGPDCHRPGLDSLFQATCGLMSVTGEADGAPQKVGVPISDFIAGMYATVAILAALRHREINGGEGQHIDIALLDSTISAFTSIMQGYLVSGIVPMRAGSSTPGNDPAGQFTCSDGDLILSAGADNQFKALAKVIDRPEWADAPEFATRPLRVSNRDIINAGINESLSAHPRHYWFEKLQAAGIMCAPINTMAEALEEPQVKHRGVVIEIEHPRAGPVPIIANPMRMSGTPIPTPRISPDVGQHTDEVLQAVLDKSSEDIEALRRNGAI